MFRKQAGFTLYELLIIMTIVGILSVIANIEYISWGQSMQVQNVARDLETRMTTLRSEAMRQSYNAEIQFTSPNIYETRLINPKDKTVISKTSYTVPSNMEVVSENGTPLTTTNSIIQWLAPYSQTPINLAYRVRRNGNSKTRSYRVAVIGERGQVVINAL